jgi:hypothetical protein
VRQTSTTFSTEHLDNPCDAFALYLPPPWAAFNSTLFINSSFTRSLRSLTYSPEILNNPLRKSTIKHSENQGDRIRNVDARVAILAVCSRYNAPIHSHTTSNFICSFLQSLLECSFKLLRQRENGKIDLT